MHFLKRLGRGLFSLILKFSLLLLATFAAIVLVFGTAGPLKAALRSSQIYSKAVDSVLDTASKKSDNKGQQQNNQQPGQPNNQQPSNQSNDNNDEGLPLDQPGLRDAAKTAITPSFVQTTAEQIIDGVYGWLHGKTAQPEFKIDISTVKQQFTQAVGDYAVNRAKTLPACNPQQVKELATSKPDPLNISCLPPGFDVNSLRTQIADQIDKNTGTILKDPVITPDTLPKDDQGKNPIQNISEKGKAVPKVFHWVTLAPWLLAGLALVAAAVVILLADERRLGLKSTAWSFISVGIILTLSVIATTVIANKLTSSSGPLAKKFNDSNVLQQPLINVVHSLGQNLNSKLLIFGIIYIVFGIGTLLILHFTKPEEAGKPKTAQKSGPMSKTDVTPESKPETLAQSSEAEKLDPVVPAKSKPKSSKIQG